MSDSTIVVAGAGSIGCFVGGHLAAAGHDVRFLGRERIAEALRASGLHLTDRDGGDVRVAAAGIAIGTDPAVLAEADVVLVAVKSGGTREMAQSIAAFAPSKAIVVSLQNGIDNAGVLQGALPQHRVVAGMVPFNVVALSGGRFHRGTDGAIVIDARATELAAALSTPKLPIETHADMRSVVWGKLLLNLNNALNALAGVPLREQLADRRWRRVLASCMDEALAALRAAAIAPARVGALPPALIPHVLRLPDALFRIVAASQLKIDAQARSSMWDDLEHRRGTEIEQLQGAVIALGEAHGVATPVNRAVRDLVQAAHARGAGSPRLGASAFAAGAP